MKKAVIFIIILSIILSQRGMMVVADVEQVLLSANTDGVNVRSGAGTQYGALFKLSYGTYVLKITTVKDSSGGLWYKIFDFNTNKTGFVASWLLNSTGITIKGSDVNFTSRVNTESLNVRSGPGREFKLVSTLSQGSKISVKRVITRSDKEEWYKFQGSNGRYYFVAGWYTEKLSTTQPNPPPSETTTEVSGTATDYVNLRSGPSTDYSKISLIDKGDTVKVIGIAKNASGELWLQIDNKGSLGWVYSIYFNVDKLSSLDTTFIGGSGTTNDAVNIRECPSTSSNSLQVLGKGLNVQILGIATNKDKETWYEIISNGSYGWVRSDLVESKPAEKGLLKNITWLIAPTGIDVNISGEKLKKPQVSLLENPLRLTLNFDTSSLLNESSSLEVNVYPINRIRYEAVNSSVTVTADLIREIPYNVEYKNDKLVVLHLTLPKQGQKLIELSGREIYANVKTINGKTYIDLEDFARTFDISIDDSTQSVNFFGVAVSLDKSKIISSDSSLFIFVDDLASAFNIYTLETEHEIYIDPVLTNFKKVNNIIDLSFSFPTDIKKTTQNGKDYIALYADFGGFSLPNSRKRNASTPPQILVEVGNNPVIDAKENLVRLTLSSDSKTGNLSNRTVIIDPGHGSYNGPYLDVGATGPTGIKEAYVVLDLSLRLKKLLEDKGAKVILTHDTVDNQSNPTLAQRVAIANGSGGDLFLSIHLNASTSFDGQGTETYYWYDTSKKYAQAIQNALVSSLGTADRGIKKDYLYLCRNVTTMPSILAEIVFVSNPSEEAKCKDSAFLDKVAQALEKGIEDYLNG